MKVTEYINLKKIDQTQHEYVFSKKNIFSLRYLSLYVLNSANTTNYIINNAAQ